MCLYPKLILNPKYKANKKNGWNPPPVTDERVKYVPIGCQKCIECMKKKQREWTVRLNEEIRNNPNAIFATLTMSNESYSKLHKETKNKYKNTEGYELDNLIATRATRLMLERYRKKNKRSVKHWLITELGGNGTENIHIHGIIWNKLTKKELENYWQYGIADNGKFVNEATVGYITKYITKIDPKHKNYKPIILCSAGIGNNYTKRTDSQQNKYVPHETKETYKLRNGKKLALPIYYRNKIYTEEEKEKLWIEKLNKQERWIMGEKIDISKTETEYNKLLKYYQQKNKKLGYGDDTKNWNEEQYERERRILKQNERINKQKNK